MTEVVGAGAGGIESEELAALPGGGVLVEVETRAVDGGSQAGGVFARVVEVWGETAGLGVDEVVAVGEDVVEQPRSGGVVGKVGEGVGVRGTSRGCRRCGRARDR
ncbi:hypothetical protein [Streptomyces virginiae]